jgi:hypothetical protein
MKLELQEKLFNKYPNLYKQRHLPMTETCMNWGICTGPGWYNLIDELSSKLEPMGVEAVQVKEKLAGLRYYISFGNDEAYELINKAEEESYKICEECGEPGKIRGKVWLKTLCNKCFKEWKRYGD